MAADPTLGLHPESDWEWAWNHRRRFTDPTKETLGGAVLGAVTFLATGIATAKPGEQINWAAGAIAGVIAAVVSAFLLPLSEAFWIYLRNHRSIDELSNLQAEFNLVSNKRDIYRKGMESTSAEVTRQHGEICKLRELLHDALNESNHNLQLLTAANSRILDLEQFGADLKVQLEHNQKDQAFADVLTERYKHALHKIMNWPVGPDPMNHDRDEWAKWLSLETEWTAETVRVLKNYPCSAQIVSLFEEIHEFHFGDFHIDMLVNARKSMFSERLKRLKRIIDHFADDAVLTL